ncbi:LacI family DNA-binding transcriptional regulator [Cohnella faecalis]|uniref:LacI family DNA-binding transcriptional regulator n=1 Tax=Cohnella faecalis TaxID=2315694 RepID=UPI00360F7921
MATRKEVAELAGVSEATVSRVLNGVGPMKESTRKRVLEAADQLKYQLNAVASSFARGRSGNIGVVLPHVPKVSLFSTYYFSELLSGIGEATRARGYGLLLLFRDPGEPYDYSSLFRTQRIDACIVLGASSFPAETSSIVKLGEEGFPFVVMDQRIDDPRVSVVAADHAEGSRLAVKHFVDKGFRSIGFLNGSPQYSNSSDRLSGYRKALEESGIPYDESILYEGNYSRKSGYVAAAKVHADLSRLDALFVANDRMAVGLIQGLRERGVRLPEDLPIVGYDNSDAAAMTEPPLTTVKVPFYEMGKLAADKLFDRIEGEESGEPSAIRELLHTELIVRRSSGQ